MAIGSRVLAAAGHVLTGPFWYHPIVSFEPYEDGFGIMRDAQTAKPKAFRTGDGWFPYNLAVNLAQMQG